MIWEINGSTAGDALQSCSKLNQIPLTLHSCAYFERYVNLCEASASAAAIVTRFGVPGSNPGWQTGDGTPFQYFDCNGGSNQSFALGSADTPPISFDWNFGLGGGVSGWVSIDTRSRTEGNDRVLIRAAAAFATFWCAHITLAGVHAGSNSVIAQIDQNALALLARSH